VVAIAIGGLLGRDSGARQFLRMAGITVVVGQLAEPVVWQPDRSPAATAVIVTNLALGLALALRPDCAVDPTDRAPQAAGR
jgi:hypothetical protein